jgi:hypothetical protein
MTWREEIWEKIRKLEGESERLKAQLMDATDKEVKISLGAEITSLSAQITAKTKLLTAIIKSQQGKF